MSEKTDQLSHQIVAQKETVIKAGISSVLGDDWMISDITGRGSITILPDKTEIFAFDGVDLIHFFHVETSIDHSHTGIMMKATQKYKLLY